MYNQRFLNNCQIHLGRDRKVWCFDCQINSGKDQYKCNFHHPALLADCNYLHLNQYNLELPNYHWNMIHHQLLHSDYSYHMKDQCNHKLDYSRTNHHLELHLDYIVIGRICTTIYGIISTGSIVFGSSRIVIVCIFICTSFITSTSLSNRNIS